MEQRILGKSLRVSAVGLGCMGLSHAYGAPVEKADAVRFIGNAYPVLFTEQVGGGVKPRSSLTF